MNDKQLDFQEWQDAIIKKVSAIYTLTDRQIRCSSLREEIREWIRTEEASGNKPTIGDGAKEFGLTPSQFIQERDQA